MKRIVVADDDQNVRILFNDVLSEEGYEVTGVASGTEAIREVEKATPDLLILDIKMPEMHGLEVLERLRRVNHELPVIVCTAYKHMDDDPMVRESDVQAYLVKPVDINVLKDTVKKVVGE
jgi:two-component system response regulator (stage 0 sporulation protein F)